MPAPSTDRVLTTVARVARALHPGRSLAEPTPATSLDKDLGLDSLGRVELLAALEADLGVRLPESVLARADTVQDLVDAVEAAPGAGPRGAATGTSPGRAASNALGVAAPVPHHARSLVEALDFHAQAHPDRLWMWLYGDDDQATEVTYGGLLAAAEEIAAGLLEEGLQRGDRIALMLPTCPEYFPSFFGILLAGGVPVPIYPPVRMNQIEDHLRRQAAILANAGVPILVTVPEARSLAGFLEGQVPGLRRVMTAADLRGRGRAATRPRIAPDDLAFLQYTSGSTGSPKGVMVGHDNLLANMRGMARGLDAQNDRDVFVSWLPLYHDLGLIGAALSTMLEGVPLALMSPIKFLTRPARWLEALTRHQGTLSAGPNFAYELCVRRIPEEELGGFDLSRWRVAINGAEPISPATVERFSTRFARVGFKPEAMYPCYGMAESCLGVAMSPINRRPRIDRIDRLAFTSRGKAEPAAPDAGADALVFVGCGLPMAGHEVRIVDEHGLELRERHEGRIQFTGPSATRGYFQNPEATAQLLVGEWRETGDRGYLADGEVYVTGRAKDIIIKAGRNIYPQELEEAVGDLEGIRKGCVAVFGSPDPATGTERVVVMAEAKEPAGPGREALVAKVQELAQRLLGEPADEVLLVPPQAVPKTSSGKIRRASARELYLTGAASAPARAVWLQLASLWLAGARSFVRSLGRRIWGWIWAAWFWASFFAVVIPTWVGLALLPSPGLRFALASWATWLWRQLVGIRLEARGLETLVATRPAVIVINHQSYLDAPILLSCAPLPYHAVVKRELAAGLVPRVFFEGLGALFVERHDRQQAVDDAHRIRDAAAAGRSVAFFPEGTFVRAPGLLGFHLGAFAIAAEAGLPVIPVVLKGTRAILRPDQWFPRPGRISVEVGPPILPAGKSLADQVALRDQARAWILARCGEPDAVEIREAPRG